MGLVNSKIFSGDSLRARDNIPRVASMSSWRGRLPIWGAVKDSLEKHTAGILAENSAHRRNGRSRSHEVTQARWVGREHHSPV
jgi:hypothetical protein